VARDLTEDPAYVDARSKGACSTRLRWLTRFGKGVVLLMRDGVQLVGVGISELLSKQRQPRRDAMASSRV
jgi:hypothetical protein